MEEKTVKPIGNAGSPAKRKSALSISTLYLSIVGILLLGYATMNKGFAYLGVYPLYVGEAVLGVGLLLVLVGVGSFRIFRSPIVWVLLVFVTWEMMIAIPGVSKFGMVAIRDSVIWMYALYALLVSAALLRSRAFLKVPQWYNYVLPAWVVITPMLFLVGVIAPQIVPQYPGSGVPIVAVKPGDMGVQIGGAAAFMALGLHKKFRRSFSRNRMAQEFYIWGFLLFGLIACGSRNRGGLISALVACMIVALFKPMNRLTKMLLPALIVLMVAYAVDLKIPFGSSGRDISLTQIADNITSVFFESNKGGLEVTERWREQWWEKILDDTMFGEHFWTGLGFGTDIARRHGFVDPHGGNRSPHNGHLTILARSGVPGFMLWIILYGTVLYSLLRAVFTARAMRQPVLADLNIWILAFLTAFGINASVDVFLEGPQGGIWFWCLVGYAIALTEEQRVLFSRAAIAARTPQRYPMPSR